MMGRRRTKVLAAGACLLSLGAAAAFGSSSAAQGSARPVISGDPAVGSTLTASASPTGQTLYQWQGCDPDIANCADSLVHTDPNWFDLTGQSHAGSSYTVTPADAGNFIRVLVHDNNTGDKWATSVPVGPVPEPPAPPAPPGITAPDQAIQPEHGLSLLVEPTGGTVLIKLPGAPGFTPLSGLQKIPVDSVLDTRGGKVRVIAATGELGDTTEDNSVDFYEGLVRLQQAGSTNAPTVAKLIQKLRCGKAKGAKASAAGGPLAATSKGRSSRIWGSGHGNYGSRGSGGTGSVRGTTWLTKDTCKGTFFKVTEGIGISVFDFDLDKTVGIGPGQSYLARNR
jgi:hypothetical protein